ncbi:hypothetical protein B0H13DRAFT_1891987 [Mycena leptocephala]|nr:hypothetical protein B0H13DRAFT_1891987 [Mycena leptocephala]
MSRGRFTFPHRNIQYYHSGSPGIYPPELHALYAGVVFRYCRFLLRKLLRTRRDRQVYPGESTADKSLNCLLALLFPASGLLRGLNAIARRATFTSSALAQVARSGALCMVVRNNQWEPDSGFKSTHIRLKLPYIPPFARESSSGWDYLDTGSFYVSSLSKVHGVHRLPRGYSFAYVPRDAVVLPLVPKVDPILSADYNAPKALAALVQGVYSAFTLFNSQGDQVQRYGYAAFGLTVLPYTTMTFFNLIGNILTPEYSTLYLVDSDILAEARMRPGAVFHNLVGKLVTGTSPIPSVTRPARLFGIIPMEDETPDRCEELWGTFNVVIDHLGRRSTGITWAKFSIDSTAGATSSDIELTCLDEGDSANSASESVVKPPALDGIRTLQGPYPRSCISIQVPACSPFERRGRGSISATGVHRVVFLTLIVIIFMILLLGYLSEWFSPGNSTYTQRSTAMQWLAMGVFIGVPAPLLMSKVHASLRRVASCVYILANSFAAIEGMVVVGKMFREYGTCIKV